MWILEKLYFKISRGSMPPDPSSVPAPLALDPIFSRINSVPLPLGLQFHATYRLKNNYLDISITVLKFLKKNINLLPNTCNFTVTFC